MNMNTDVNMNVTMKTTMNMNLNTKSESKIDIDSVMGIERDTVSDRDAGRDTYCSGQKTPDYS